LVVIPGMAACAGIGGVIVVPVVALCAVAGNSRMRAIKGVVAVVAVKGSWAPSGRSCVAAGTIGGQPERIVVGVGRSVEVGGMAAGAIGGRASVAAAVAVKAVGAQVSPGKREGGSVVVKNVVRIAHRVAGQAGRIFVNIAAHAFVLAIGLGAGMAAGAGELRIIGGVGMAFGTGIPLAFVRAGIDGEVLGIVVERRWGPAILGVARNTVGGELCSSVARVSGIVIIIAVAPEARIGGVAVAPVMAGRTIIGDSRVRTVEGIELAVDIKTCRHPIGLYGMAGRAVRGQPKGFMVGVHSSRVVLRVAAVTGIGGVIVIPVVAGYAVVFNGLVPPRQWVVGVVVE